MLENVKNLLSDGVTALGGILIVFGLVFPISRWCLRRILESSCRENFRPLLSINIADQNTSNPESKITT